MLEGLPEANYRAAADFIRFLSSADVQARWHESTGYLPITQEAYDLARTRGYHERVPDAEVAVRQMTGRAPDANTRGIRLADFVTVRERIEDELEQVWSGAASAEEALARATERAQNVLDRARR